MHGALRRRVLEANRRLHAQGLVTHTAPSPRWAESLTAVLTRLLDGGAEALPQPLLEKHYRRKHGPRATYGQSRPSSRRIS